MKEITLREHMSNAARARWAGMTKEQRSEAMRHAARVRWGKSKLKSSTVPHTGDTSTNDTK